MHDLALAYDALWIFWLLFWFASATNTKRDAQPGSSGWRLYWITVVVACIFVPRFFPSYFDRRLHSGNFTFVLICLLLTAAGLAFTIWARVVLGSNWSSDPTIKVGHELIQRGPYRLVRHPIYTGLILAGFASIVADGRVRDVYYAVLIIVSLAIKVRMEERLMLRQFPEAYPEYCRHTKRLIPGIY